MCPYCGKTDCATRKECADAAEKIARQDRAGLEHFTRDLPIKRGAV